MLLLIIVSSVIKTSYVVSKLCFSPSPTVLQTRHKSLLSCIIEPCVSLHCTCKLEFKLGQHHCFEHNLIYSVGKFTDSPPLFLDFVLTTSKCLCVVIHWI